MPTLNFDEITLSEGGEQRLAAGFGGFNWLQAGIYNPDGAIAGYVSTSGQNILFIAEAGNNEVGGYEDAAAGTPLTMTRAQAFNLESLNLSSAFRPGLTVTIRAYADEAGQHVIGQKTVVVGLAEQQGVSFLGGLDFGTFLGAQRVEFNANDGDAATLDYFGIDNLTFSDTNTVVLNFDDIILPAGGEVPIASYQGFTFSQTGVYSPDGLVPGYTVSSGSNLAFIAEAGNFEVAGYENPAGSPVVITHSSQFSFLGGAFSAAFRSGLAITIRGYADEAGTQLVAERTIVANADTAEQFSFLDGEFAGLLRLEFNANDGNASTIDYFGFDDLTFFVAPAAAPTLGDVASLSFAPELTNFAGSADLSSLSAEILIA
ncbi:MAG: hypothetical protein H2054_06535 [Sphingomonas sp.]|uniref:hypothetical protein n=1 Tax=Sphingomonas sp. TaxID=28214 RepID=UPI00180DB20E|nr:hypothetical protein [Sphingomonas sp.]